MCCLCGSTLVAVALSVVAAVVTAVAGLVAAGATLLVDVVAGANMVHVFAVAAVTKVFLSLFLSCCYRSCSYRC